MESVHIITINDYELGKTASDFASNNNRRIQNWVSSVPCSFITSKGDYYINNLGRYSRSCKYIKYSYSPKYTSYVEILDEGRKLIYYRGFKNEIKTKVIHSPKGMLFQKDSYGLLIRRLSDNMDYHPTKDDLQSKKFVSIIREKMASNYKARLYQKQLKKQQKKTEKIFNKDLKNTMVTLFDSRKAGNCVEGSLSFAEKRLGVSRKEILDGGFLFKIPAIKLVKTGEQKALNAAKVAWTRETTICT